MLRANGVAGELGDTVTSFDDIVQRAEQIAVAAQQQSIGRPSIQLLVFPAVWVGSG